MIVSFHDQASEELFSRENSARARKLLPRALFPIAWRKLDMLARATDLMDLRKPPGNRLEELQGDRRGQHSIRINEKYRICFRWTDQGASDVEITDYH